MYEKCSAFSMKALSKALPDIFLGTNWPTAASPSLKVGILLQ